MDKCPHLLTSAARRPHLRRSGSAVAAQLQRSCIGSVTWAFPTVSSSLVCPVLFREVKQHAVAGFSSYSNKAAGIGGHLQWVQKPKFGDLGGDSTADSTVKSH